MKSNKRYYGVEKPMSEHHIIPKSMGGSEYFINKVQVTQTFHDALNTMFGNKLPHEQMGAILDLSGEVFKPEFSGVIREALNLITIEEMYNKKCYIQRILGVKY